MKQEFILLTDARTKTQIRVRASMIGSYRTAESIANLQAREPATQGTLVQTVYGSELVTDTPQAIDAMLSE